MGANPWSCIRQIRSRLGLNVAAVQVNIGVENGLKGIIDIVRNRAIYFDGDKG
jgi:elongation factor G